MRTSRFFLPLIVALLSFSKVCATDKPVPPDLSLEKTSSNSEISEEELLSGALAYATRASSELSQSRLASSGKFSIRELEILEQLGMVGIIYDGPFALDTMYALALKLKGFSEEQKPKIKGPVYSDPAAEKHFWKQLTVRVDRLNSLKMEVFPCIQKCSYSEFFKIVCEKFEDGDDRSWCLGLKEKIQSKNKEKWEKIEVSCSMLQRFKDAFFLNRKEPTKKAE